MKDELQEESNDGALLRRYREKTGQFVEPHEARKLDRATEVGRGRTVEEDRLLRDEDDARIELPR